MERTLQQYPDEEEHPCKCDDKYAVCVDDDFEWIKRIYYEYRRYYWCKKCDCTWYLEEYMEVKHSVVVITAEPKESEE